MNNEQIQIWETIYTENYWLAKWNGINKLQFFFDDYYQLEVEIDNKNIDFKFLVDHATREAKGAIKTLEANWPPKRD
tara:strand:- start:7459 stop:7689 length:231 start_codon:yes stop_codon:yes gene_type:complete